MPKYKNEDIMTQDLQDWKDFININNDLKYKTCIINSMGKAPYYTCTFLRLCGNPQAHEARD